MSNQTPANLPVNMFTLLKEFEKEVPPRVWQSMIGKLNDNYVANINAATVQQKKSLERATADMQGRVADVVAAVELQVGAFKAQVSAENEVYRKTLLERAGNNEREFQRLVDIGSAVELLAGVFAGAIAKRELTIQAEDKS